MNYCYKIDDENNENTHECIDYETYESNNFIPMISK